MKHLSATCYDFYLLCKPISLGFNAPSSTGNCTGGMYVIISLLKRAEITAHGELLQYLIVNEESLKSFLEVLPDSVA